MFEISKQMNEELFEKGKIVFKVDARSEVIEKWCAKMREITGVLVGWYYACSHGVIRTMPENHSLVYEAGINELLKENPFFNVIRFVSDSGLEGIPHNDQLVLLVQGPVEVIKEWCDKMSLIVGIPVNWRYESIDVGIFIKSEYYNEFIFEAAKALATSNPFYELCIFDCDENYAHRESELVRKTCIQPKNWGILSMSRAYTEYFSK